MERRVSDLGGAKRQTACVLGSEDQSQEWNEGPSPAFWLVGPQKRNIKEGTVFGD